MITLGTDANNDLIVTAAGNVAVFSGLAALAADCRSAMQAQQGEMPFAADRGIPTIATAYNSLRPALFEAAARVALKRIDGVIDVISFDVERSGNKALYNATIRTVYGETTIDGGL